MKARNRLPFKDDFITGIRLQDKDDLKILLRAINIEAKLDGKSKSDSSSSSKKKLKKAKRGSPSIIFQKEINNGYVLKELINN